MGDETHENQDFSSGPPRENPGYTFYGVFSGSQHFTVAGGTFTNTTTDKPLSYSSDCPVRLKYAWISTLVLQNTDVNDAAVRKLHSAKIPGHKSSVTVAPYQGENAGKEWQQDVAKYMAVRQVTHLPYEQDH
ncbi:hypothetical protein DFH08DRAFT_811807 [Mycena albidolilacea]|uniref:Uncharacterized protein n=1 Tax=Mycena albidolilacea TaxID=1033008 RepID=A0AAD6ZVS7_9AGAR|nr:hypothetical protein DFH08DRAFT_811807 [Mycena albidolilacea]